MPPEPADGAPTPPLYFDSLRQQLVDAATMRTRRRRTRVQTLLPVAIVIAGGVAAVLGLVSAPANAAVEVYRAGDRVEVRLVGEDLSPDDIERAGAKAGLRLSVSRRPVGPSLANRFLAASADPALPPNFSRFNESTGAFRGFSLPASWQGSLKLDLGQPARGNERYAKSSDAFAPKEPLACHDIRGRSAAEAAVVLRSLPGLRVSWELLSPSGARSTTASESPSAEVIGAVAISRSEVIVSLADGDFRPPQVETRCLNQG